MTNGHAQCSPSGADGWMACAGWESSPESSSYADEGTDAHTLGSTVLLNPGWMAADFIGKPLPLGHTVDDAMATAIQKYVDLIRSIPGFLLVEQSMPLEEITGEKDAQGTGDAIILDFESQWITVGDLKYGTGVRVHAENNKQLKHYGLSALLKFDFLAHWKGVRAIICQPRIEGGFSEDTFWREELLIFGKESFQAAKFYRKHHSKPLPKLFKEGRLVATKKGCRWCDRDKRKAVCPAYAAMLISDQTVEFSEIEND